MNASPLWQIFGLEPPAMSSKTSELGMSHDGEKCKTLKVMRKRPALAGNDQIDLHRRAINSMLNCTNGRECEDRALCTITCAALLKELP
ncbi:hypothetical protein [Paramagnetospirillum caucaseum]|uniref:hypothetical protein n=1 Tax=Paramagnetospirillum caucaseum TaxID=1244869 RepID=UPI001267D498|nr:hypothetical protein [Paramagnetospirillum caucaseum]